MKETYFWTPVQKLPEIIIQEEGPILDIGGGGEGIIGQLYGSRVIAIDQRKEELEETDNQAIKAVMDARELSFLPDSFASVTSLFTLLYMNDEVLEQSLKEIYRVLKPGGTFYLWDTAFQEATAYEEDIFVLHLSYVINGQEKDTGFGRRLIGTGRSMDTYQRKLQAAGFVISQASEGDYLFEIKATK